MIPGILCVFLVITTGFLEIMDSRFIVFRNEFAITNKKPLLGICVGLQMFADLGYEETETKGLGWISGKVSKIDNQNNRRAFYDEIHFDSVAPVLGLAKLKEDNNGETDFSQVEIITEEEMNNYNLERPLFITSN